MRQFIDGTPGALNLEIRQPSINVMGDVAILTAYWLLTMPTPEGGSQVMQGRITDVLKKIEGNGSLFMNTDQFSLHHKVITEVTIPGAHIKLKQLQSLQFGLMAWFKRGLTAPLLILPQTLSLHKFFR